MKLIKDFLNGLINALGKVLLVVALIIMIGVMATWTVGLIHFTNQGGCHLEESRVVCEFSRE